MAKKPIDEMTERELAQEMGSKPVTDWGHHAAKAELEGRRTQAQLRATRYMLVSSTAAAVSAIASAITCDLAFRSGR
jgi:hypothetical protein